MDDLSKYKPAVHKTYLLLLAGLVWLSVGIMLLVFAFRWLSAIADIDGYLFACAGMLLGLTVHHFGFLKIVDKNLVRIDQMHGYRCLFSFFPWKSYLLVIVMICMGSILRHSMIPKGYLAIVYIGIGLALVLSSIRYLRIFYSEIKE